MTELLMGSRTPGAQYWARGGHAHFWAKNTNFGKHGQNHANGCSTCSCWSPVYQDIFLFEIGQKMTELWTKNVCPYMGTQAKFSLILPITAAKMWILGQKKCQK